MRCGSGPVAAATDTSRETGVRCMLGEWAGRCRFSETARTVLEQLVRHCAARQQVHWPPGMINQRVVGFESRRVVDDRTKVLDAVLARGRMLHEAKQRIPWSGPRHRAIRVIRQPRFYQRTLIGGNRIAEDRCRAKQRQECGQSSSRCGRSLSARLTCIPRGRTVYLADLAAR